MPIDSAKDVSETLAGVIVRSATVRSGVLDLSIQFEGDSTLEVLPMSSGYEAWQIDRAADRSSVIACGGGELFRHEQPAPEDV